MEKKKFKFVLTKKETKRLTSDVPGGIPNTIGLNAREDTAPGSKNDTGISGRKFPSRCSNNCPHKRTIKVQCG